MPSVSDSAPTTYTRIALWLLGALVAVGVLSVTASYAPGVMKRLIVFYIVYGIACGFVLDWLAGELLTRRGSWLPVIAGVLCAAGALNLGWLSYRHFEQARHLLAQQRSKDVQILETLRQASENDPAVREEYAEELRQFSPRFEDYLAHRVSSLGKWPAPWPLVLWLGEVSIAGVACSLTLRQLNRTRRSTSNLSM
ncbi:hypothetical protein [Planctomicrobium piriforme]|uniref:hypothetical protein n=1 Tax=Planctomicrobium piriforme TaxID=1576369 RepID=UPI0011136AE5|nr:hypothetical protein [Planctomicrobium piriforme]